jgi:hypothetical protein
MKRKLNEMSLSELKRELMILRLRKVHVGMDRKIKREIRKMICDRRKSI